MKPLLLSLLTPLAMMGQQAATPQELPPSIYFSTYIYADVPSLIIEIGCRCVKIETQDESIVIHEDNSATWGNGKLHTEEERRLIIFLVDTIVRIAEPSKGYKHWQELLKTTEHPK